MESLGGQVKKPDHSLVLKHHKILVRNLKVTQLTESEAFFSREISSAQKDSR